MKLKLTNQQMRQLGGILEGYVSGLRRANFTTPGKYQAQIIEAEQLISSLKSQLTTSKEDKWPQKEESGGKPAPAKSAT